MCFEIGNKVVVIDDVIRGEVFGFLDELVLVKDEEGMEYRFLKTELVKIEVEQKELSKYLNINNTILKEKISKEQPKKNNFIKSKNEVVMEVDLHAEKILKSTKGMDNYDILSFQIEKARQKIEYCLSKKISKIVFIHGVGEGVLKTELNYLLNRYPVKYYEASYQKYGMGATEVYVYQNPN
ncbi:DNA mismatch repair protein MutS [Tenacibaculum sp. E3R01]|uniref:Smr/MutS family protein n=1 Tax=unclassified Tenacibaculum TaxID=2635139 RepID=UPI0008955826|nr:MULTISPECIES: Smr/MutS family protein [unclassified Tenacibaculum]RBW61267.1 DNA mismatch repair protein MutS [Tenacibaculum sp. E3R01]SEE38896.1 Smr domain-containing protein [Tenacibaculum sp. MAR_2010_89]